MELRLIKFETPDLKRPGGELPLQQQRNAPDFRRHACRHPGGIVDADLRRRQMRMPRPEVHLKLAADTNRSARVRSEVAQQVPLEVVLGHPQRRAAHHDERAQ
jgi:hypothetical protein